MIRFIMVLLLTGICSYTAAFLMPWWIPMTISFAIVLILPMSNSKAITATGLGTAIAYSAMCIQTDIANQHILSSKMAVLFLKTPSYPVMILLTALIGLITAALGGFTGNLFHQLLIAKKK